MLADVVLLELWLCGEYDADGTDEVVQAEVEDAFARIQARMLVVQSVLWPSDDDVSDAEGSAEDSVSSDENPYG